MNHLNRIRGYMIKENTNKTDKKSSMEMKYFIFGLDNQIYLTSNIALFQYLINNSNTIEMLYAKCERYLKKIVFIEKMKPSELKVHNQPEKFPFYNSKYFELNLKVNENNKISESTISTFKNQDFLNFYVFSFDDDFIMSLHGFAKSYNEFISKSKKKEEFLKEKISILKNEEEMLGIETLNYKKHLENYKIKMRLIINKMEKDKKDITENVQIIQKKIKKEENEEENNEENNNKLVKLENGSLYAGPLKNGMPHGNGKEFLDDGSSYVGDFFEGYWHGSGYLVDSENFICYGEFIKGRVVGI